MRIPRVVIAAIGVGLLLAGCATTDGPLTESQQRDADRELRLEREAVANQLQTEIGELTGVLLGRAAPHANINVSGASVLVRLDYELPDADKVATLLEVRDILVANDTFDEYALTAIFDSPHELPLGSRIYVPSVGVWDDMEAELRLWLEVTAAVPMVGMTEMAGTFGPSVEILPAVLPDGSVQSEDEIRATIDEIWDLASDDDVYIEIKGGLG